MAFEIMKEILKNKYDLKEMELNSLLEITQAINNNLPEDSLYKIYNFTLRANLNIKKIALYVLDEAWSCKVNFGTKGDFFKIALDPIFLETKSIGPVNGKLKEGVFGEFETVIPVAHKDHTLAFVFIEGVDDMNAAEANTNFIQALSNIIIVAIENKKLARRQLRQEALRKELEIARHVQQFLFPKDLPNKTNLKVEASYLPHQSIGGDYYDFIEIDEDRFLLCIADVSGKGIPAAILMSNFQASLRTLVRKTTSLKEIINELNYHILQNANGENFITFFVAIFDKRERVLRYVNSGHNQPLLIKNKHEELWLDKGSTILGCFKKLPFLHEGIVSDLDEFFFFAFTDGLTETFNEEDQEFGVENLRELLEENRTELHVLHRTVLEKLDQFRGTVAFKDDITMLSCYYNGLL